MTPPSTFVRVVDTGLAGGGHNAATDRAWLESRADGRCGDVLRFHLSQPTASIGRHQALDRELRVDYCRRRGIEVVRRATSGGALYLDSGQLGFSLIVQRPVAWRDLALAQLLERGSAAVAAGLRQLGIAATTKSPNDVEVGGRKIASVFVAQRGDAVLLHGSVLLDADVETMLKALRIPTEKLSPDGLAAARERLTAVNACRGDPLPIAVLKTALMNGIAKRLELQLHGGVDAAPIDIPSSKQFAAERALVQSIVWDDSGERKIEALIRTAGGTLRVRADFAPLGTRLRGVEFATDAHLEPADFCVELQRALEGLPLAQLGGRIADFVQRHRLDAIGFGAGDIEQLLLQLVDKRRVAQQCGLGAAQANALMPFAGAAGLDSAAVLGKASVMLVPYCAKPTWCEWRQRDGCTECGLCEVGTAYALARERNMQVTTITNYEHLVATLTAMKAKQVEAYVGMCCSNFFIKRYRAFAEAGVPALLMDISGSNCYELQQEEQAYAGTFQAEARLDAGLATQVMKFVPRRALPEARNDEAAAAT
ncbi:MAG: lipoate--protein ligase family protein [Betaproteobacteria bacterium]|nr:lipoate--protein ligase family protein [Betaproteobacteria bacterium]